MSEGRQESIAPQDHGALRIVPLTYAKFKTAEHNVRRRFDDLNENRFFMELTLETLST